MTKNSNGTTVVDALPPRRKTHEPYHRIILNFPPALAARVIELAGRERRSITKQIEVLVEQALEDKDVAA